MNKKQEIINSHMNCTCDEAYKSRKLTDPNCFLCEWCEEIELMLQHIGQAIIQSRLSQLLSRVRFYYD